MRNYINALLVVKIFILTLGMIIVVIPIVLDSFAEEIDFDRLVNAIIQIESGGKADAYNKKSGCIGLMQISPIVIKEYSDWVNINNCDQPTNEIKHYTDWGVKEWIIPEYNIRLGTWYLHRLKNHYGCSTIEQILMAYNWGIGNCKKNNFDLKKAPKETRDYVRKVLKLYKEAK